MLQTYWNFFDARRSVMPSPREVQEGEELEVDEEGGEGEEEETNAHPR